MRTRYRSGKLFLAALGIFTAAVFLFVGIFWWNGREYFSLDPQKEYFLLVVACEDETASAVAGQVYLAGGAGYLLGGEGVAVACYFTLREAESVQTAMRAKGVETQIVTCASQKMYLNGKKAAAGERIGANADTADCCARILYDTANGLERLSVTQEQARAAVRGVADSLKGLREGNSGGTFSLWNALLLRAERRARETAAGILFAKDLRYVQIELCLAVSSLEDYFS